MDLAEYLERFPFGEKFILGIIDPDGTPIRISDEVYRTEPTDTPGNVQFRPIIEDVPRLAREIRSRWGGGVSGSWGPIKTATKDAGAVDLSTVDIKGKKFTLMLTGPRSEVPFDEAAVVLQGYIDSRSGDVDGGLTINLRDRRQLLDSIILPLNRFDAASESANFPASNDGKVKPVVLGKAFNVESPVIDSVTHKRQVSDPAFGQINDVLAVYNNGVSVSFTKDLANNAYTPTVTPLENEVITADIEGVKDGGTLMTQHSEFITWILKTFAGYTDPEIDITGFPTEDAYCLITGSKSVSAILDELTKSVLAIWQCTRLDTFKARLIEVPGTGSATFNETKQIGRLNWKEDGDVYYRIPYSYNQNNTKLTQLGTVGDVSKEIWLKSDSDKAAEEDLSIQSDYPDAKEAPEIKTLFVAKSPAQAVAARALALYGELRRTCTVTFPFVDPPLFILDDVTLSDADVMTGDCQIRSLTEEYGGDAPVLNAGVWK